METVERLVEYFGYYQLNLDFQTFLKREVGSLSEFDEISSYQVNREFNLELGYTNERMIREADLDKPLTGGHLIFTHFNIFPLTAKLFKELPYGLTFADSMDVVRRKAGTPTQTIEEKIPILGLKTIDHFSIGDNKLSVDYTPNGNVNFLQIRTEKKFIREETRPAHNKMLLQ